MPYTGDTHIVSCARDGMVRLAELSSTGICKGTRKLAQHKGAAHKVRQHVQAAKAIRCCPSPLEVRCVNLCSGKDIFSTAVTANIHQSIAGFDHCVASRNFPISTKHFVNRARLLH